MKTLGLLLTAISLVASAQPARAARFSLMGRAGSFAFSIADRPTPDSWFEGVSFVIYDVPAPSRSGLIDVTLYNEDWFDEDHRSLQIEDYRAGLSLYELFGAQLYSGGELAPVFNHGRYRLRDANGEPFDLTIAADGAAVPEPASWATILAGLGSAGLMLRRRARVGRTAAFG